MSSVSHNGNGNGTGSGQRRRSDHSPPRMMGGKGEQQREEMEGMDHGENDVLAAEPKRKGGLMRSGNVGHRPLHLDHLPFVLIFCEPVLG